MDLSYELFLREDELARAEAVWGGGEGQLRILVNVSAFTPDRRWPSDRFAAVVRYLRHKVPSARVLVIGDPRDWDTVREVASAGRAEPVNVSPVREAFALVAKADALITPDTSLAHAAAAAGTPVAVLFRGDWLVNAPYGARLVPVVSDGSTLNDLPVERVLAGTDQLLALAVIDREFVH
jgi:ADP-heptose:LPS heptosyltransferase